MTVVNVNQYSDHDCGRYGKAMERTMTGEEKARSAGRVDWRYLRKCFEVKTGAGELGGIGDRLLKGSTRVLFVPVVVEDGQGNIDPYAQEGFILSREAFIEVLTEAGAIREKTSTAGVRKVTIQTFWNRKLNKPHGSLYFRLLDALYEACDSTLEDFLAEMSEEA